jgi:hypothetical protein
MSVAGKTVNRSPRHRDVITEKQFQHWLMQLAKLTGWLAFHTYRSVRSPAGFPDTVLVKEGRVIFAELKVGKNKLSPPQVRWVEELSGSEGVEVYVWRPEDRPEIERILKGE